MGLAARVGHLRIRPGAKDPALRHARVCYDHLAGDLGVHMLDAMTRRQFVRCNKHEISLTTEGERFVAKKRQIELAEIEHARRPLCKTCLDWSARRSHLAGTLGAAILSRLYELKWAARAPGNRIVNFTPNGEKQFAALFGVGEE